MALCKVPVETKLAILSHLRIRDIHSLQLVSKEWNVLIKSNETTVYHSTSLVHGFVPSLDIKIDQLEGAYHPAKVIEGMDKSWKGLCHRMFRLGNNWKGSGRSYLTAFPNAGEKPCDIKVDEKRGFVINIADIEGDDSGLVVVDKNDNVLWTQKWPFGKCSRIEYENGYLIFTNNDERKPGYKEIWRLASIPDPSPLSDQKLVGSFPYPQPSQVKVSAKSFARNKKTYPQGHFVPHAALPQNAKNACFRFHYPTLLILTGKNTVAFYDVPSRELLSTVTLDSTLRFGDSPQALPGLGRIWSIDFSSTHIFLCGMERGTRVFDRSAGTCVLDTPADRWHYATRVIRLADTSRNEETSEDLSKFDYDPTCPKHQRYDDDLFDVVHSNDDEDVDGFGSGDSSEFGSEDEGEADDSGDRGGSQVVDVFDAVPACHITWGLAGSEHAMDEEYSQVQQSDSTDSDEDSAEDDEEGMIETVPMVEEALASPSLRPRLCIGSDMRVSECGNHFVSLTNYPKYPRPSRSSQLVVVRDFKGLLPCDTDTLSKHAVQIDLDAGDCFSEFAFDRKQRVVATNNKGLWIVDIGDFLSFGGAVTVRRAIPFGGDSTAIAMTESGIYIECDPMDIRDWEKWTKDREDPCVEWMRAICGIDFAAWD
ncbi:hypothetical protein AAF712_013280 [Marasmius tenuissimus]|uniref:F-box domain-containing protein n=1 Tax=Marasmius tenuissimus TaxID=585030 RepID=A0ABR2ZF15_9AGAR